MANAYSKTRPKKLKQYPTVELPLDNKPDLPQDGQPYMRWMRAIDAHFEMFGFKPGDRVYLEVAFRHYGHRRIQHEMRPMPRAPHTFLPRQCKNPRLFGRGFLA